MNESVIVACPACGVKNRVARHDPTRRPKCGRCGTWLSEPGTVLELGDHDFQQVVGASTLPVLVDFYSPTCGPCRMLAPVIEDIARRYQGRILVAKIDTSRHQGVAAGFQIRGVPTLIFFRNGQPVDQVVGAVPAQEIEQKLARLLRDG